jgi:hypothetical protein
MKGFSVERPIFSIYLVSEQTMQLKKAGGPDYSQQKEKKGKFTVEVRSIFYLITKKIYIFLLFILLKRYEMASKIALEYRYAKKPDIRYSPKKVVPVPVTRVVDPD